MKNIYSKNRNAMGSRSDLGQLSQSPLSLNASSISKSSYSNYVNKENQVAIPKKSAMKFKSTRDVLQECKEAFQESETLLNKVKKNQDILNNRTLDLSNQPAVPFKVSTIEDDKISEDSVHEIPNDELGDENLSIDLDDITDEIQNYNLSNYNNDYDYDYNNDYNRLNNYQLDKKEQEINKLKLTNQILIRSNFDLKNSNKVLECELASYKSSNVYAETPLTVYDDNLSKFMDSLKVSLNDSINRNLNLMDIINSLQEENRGLYEENYNLNFNFSEAIKEFKGSNRKNAEIQILNEQRFKDIEEMESSNKNLRSEIDQLNLRLSQLRATEENLNLINESNLKKKKDDEELKEEFNRVKNKLLQESAQQSAVLSTSQKNFEEIGNLIQNKSKEINILKDKMAEIYSDQDELLNAKQQILTEIDQQKIAEEELNQHKKKEEKELDIAEKENAEINKAYAYKEELVREMKSILKQILEEFSEEESPEERENVDLDGMIENAIQENQTKGKEIENRKNMYEVVVERKRNVLESVENPNLSTENIDQNIDQNAEQNVYQNVDQNIYQNIGSNYYDIHSPTPLQDLEDA